MSDLYQPTDEIWVPCRFRWEAGLGCQSPSWWPCNTWDGHGIDVTDAIEAMAKRIAVLETTDDE